MYLSIAERTAGREMKKGKATSQHHWTSFQRTLGRLLSGRRVHSLFG